MQNKEIENSIYFINITDHTNDELKKVIMNFYYKEKIEYVFYDTLKTDTANIGNGEEIKRTVQHKIRDVFGSSNKA